METIDTGRSRIDVQHIQCLIVLYFQDMGVPAYKEAWRSYKQPLADRSIVPSGITTDVFDQYIGSFYSKAVKLLITSAHITSVDVSIDSS